MYPCAGLSKSAPHRANLAQSRPAPPQRTARALQSAARLTRRRPAVIAWCGVCSALLHPPGGWFWDCSLRSESARPPKHAAIRAARSAVGPSLQMQCPPRRHPAHRARHWRQRPATSQRLPARVPRPRRPKHQRRVAAKLGTAARPPMQPWLRLPAALPGHWPPARRRLPRKRPRLGR